MVFEILASTIRQEIELEGQKVKLTFFVTDIVVYVKTTTEPTKMPLKAMNEMSKVYLFSSFNHTDENKLYPSERGFNTERLPGRKVQRRLSENKKQYGLEARNWENIIHKEQPFIKYKDKKGENHTENREKIVWEKAKTEKQGVTVDGWKQ